MADNNDGRVREKTLQDILNMTIKLSDAESVELKPTPEMDDERKAFLKKAIDSVLENDDAKRLVLVTAHLLKYKVDDVLSDDQLKEISDLFEELNFLLEGMDIANDFNKLGGLKHCLSLLRCNYSSVQWRSADVIANSVQNVPQNQYSVIEEKGLEVLLYTLKKTDADMVRVKCLYALSCLIGGNNVAEKLFVDLKGVDIVLKLIADDNPKVRLKSAFLVRKIITSDSGTIRYISNKVAIAMQLISFLKMEHDDSHEVVADVLLHLIKEDANALHEFKKMENLKELFDARRKYLREQDADKYLELIEIYESLIGFL